MSRWPTWTIWLVGLALLYVGIAFAVYRFRHPWKTETELLLDAPRVLVFGAEERSHAD